MPYWLNLYGWLSPSQLTRVVQQTRRSNCSLALAYGHIPLALLNTRSVLKAFQEASIPFYLSGHLHDSHGVFHVLSASPSHE